MHILLGERISMRGVFYASGHTNGRQSRSCVSKRAATSTPACLRKEKDTSLQITNTYRIELFNWNNIYFKSRILCTTAKLLLVMRGQASPPALWQLPRLMNKLSTPKPFYSYSFVTLWPLLSYHYRWLATIYAPRRDQPSRMNESIISGWLYLG